jgi:hypothetical protein
MSSPMNLGELLSQFLRRQSAAQAEGLACAESGEVTPFEAAAVQPVEPRVAWKEATAALAFWPAAPAPKPPADWAALVSSQDSITALPLCLGNFPQLLRDWQALVNVADLAALLPRATRPAALPSIVEWAEETTRGGRFPDVLMALAACRLARHFDAASRLLQQIEPAVPKEWHAAFANERAALAWHRGQTEEAARDWAAQKESIPVLFNRGLSKLFLKQGADARTSLRAAVEKLPEESAWHHLGQLYLALAEIRR